MISLPIDQLNAMCRTARTARTISITEKNTQQAVQVFGNPIHTRKANTSMSNTSKIVFQAKKRKGGLRSRSYIFACDPSTRKMMCWRNKADQQSDDLSSCCGIYQIQQAHSKNHRDSNEVQDENQHRNYSRSSSSGSDAEWGLDRQDSISNTTRKSQRKSSSRGSMKFDVVDITSDSQKRNSRVLNLKNIDKNDMDLLHAAFSISLDEVQKEAEFRAACDKKEAMYMKLNETRAQLRALGLDTIGRIEELEERLEKGKKAKEAQDKSTALNEKGLSTSDAFFLTRTVAF